MKMGLFFFGDWRCSEVLEGVCLWVCTLYVGSLSKMELQRIVGKKKEDLSAQMTGGPLGSQTRPGPEYTSFLQTGRWGGCARLDISRKQMMFLSTDFRMCFEVLQ